MQAILFLVAIEFLDGMNSVICPGVQLSLVDSLGSNSDFLRQMVKGLNKKFIPVQSPISSYPLRYNGLLYLDITKYAFGSWTILHNIYTI